MIPLQGGTFCLVFWKCMGRQLSATSIFKDCLRGRDLPGLGLYPFQEGSRQVTDSNMNNKAHARAILTGHFSFRALPWGLPRLSSTLHFNWSFFLYLIQLPLPSCRRCKIHKDTFKALFLRVYCHLLASFSLHFVDIYMLSDHILLFPSA